MTWNVKWHMTHDTWLLTHDAWRMTHDAWRMAHDRFPEMHIGISELNSCNQVEFKQSVWISHILIQNAEYRYFTILEIQVQFNCTCISSIVKLYKVFAKVFFFSPRLLVIISCFSLSGWMTRDMGKESWPGSLEGQIWVFTKSCRFKRSFIHGEDQI